MERNSTDRVHPDQNHSGPSFDEYLLMNESEKDIAVAKSVNQLQIRIREILYLMGSESRSAAHAGQAVQFADRTDKRLSDEARQQNAHHTMS